MPELFFFRTFAKLAIVPYVGGTVANILRLIYKFSLTESPFWIHWAIVVICGYVVTGFIWFVRKIEFQGTWDKFLYGTVILHLGVSVLTHLYSIITRSNSWMGIFPLNYSYFALVYFVGLGVYCYSLGKRVAAMNVRNLK